MGDELNEVLKHLEEFLEKYTSHHKEGGKIEEHLWTRTGVVSKYALLLVARPLHPGFAGYVKRAQERYDEGVERLYVLGAFRENRFAEQVISAIAKQTKYKLLERFELYRDYRGDSGGVAAVFGK